MNKFQHTDEFGDKITGFRWTHGGVEWVTLSTDGPNDIADPDQTTGRYYGPAVALDANSQKALAAFLTAGVEA